MRKAPLVRRALQGKKIFQGLTDGAIFNAKINLPILEL